MNGFDLNEAFGVIRSQRRSLELTEPRLWQLGYGSDTVHLLFNLWYQDADSTYTPSYPNNVPQVDHVFPAEPASESEDAESEYRQGWTSCAIAWQNGISWPTACC